MNRNTACESVRQHFIAGVAFSLHSTDRERVGRSSQLASTLMKKRTEHGQD